MRVTHAFALKESEIMQALVRRFSAEPGVIDRIRSSFDEGAREWPAALAEEYGEEEAKRLLTFIQTADIPDPPKSSPKPHS